MGPSYVGRPNVLPLARGCIPDSNRVVITATNECVTIGAEGYKYNSVSVSWQLMPTLPCPNRPEPHRMIVTAANQGFTIRAKGNRMNPASMAPKRFHTLPGGGIPHPYRMVMAAAGNEGAIRAKGKRLHPGRVPFASQEQTTLINLPNMDFIIDAGHQPFPIGAKSGR